MTRLNLVLMLAVVASALYLVRVQYDSRSLFVEVDRAIALSHKLEIENERLQVEKRAQATPLRVEKLAKEQLQMRTSTPAITQYVTVAAAPANSASTAAGKAP
ncbi:cell division protein FtsL [Rhodoferax sp.]|uniref:cell division protein FtsL n=1 Tax=Rhodoferax sp. TaxID=50421 RepID=UPI0025D591FC|nr:cell division protein FtsL [Rhodoferax sp.]